MNETIKVIKSRRSIRRFKPEQIPDSALQEILECAIYAPNARNQQKWHFTVVQNEDMTNKMERIMKENMMRSGVDFLMKRASDPNFSVFGNAPTVILITADKQAFSNFVQLDCALAAENVLIAAESLGIGSHIMTSTEFLFKSKQGDILKKELGIPDGYEHVCTIALGYKDETPTAKPRDKSVINYVK
ncbi:MAG: nitroreductase family protein [Candidatus Bathycorpusculaceae bacterium]